MLNKGEGNISQFVKSVSIDGSLRVQTTNLPPHFASDSFSDKLNAVSTNEQNSLMARGVSKSSQKQPHQNEQLQQQQQLEANAAFQQHKRFLQNYKKERGEEIKMIRDRYFSNNFTSQSLVQEEQQQDYQIQQEQKPTTSSNYLLDAVSAKIQYINTKLQKEILSNPPKHQRRTFKLFDGAVSTKNDLERVAKQRRFMRSQQEKYEYKEPEMPIKHLAAIKNKIQTQSHDYEADLGRKAREFIEKVQREQQKLLGKQMIRKNKEEFKRLLQQKQERKKSQQFEEIKKEERRLKAEQKLLVMREKIRIQKIVNRNSIQELRKKRADKQYKLQAVRQSIKQAQKEIKLNKNATISDRMQRRGKTSSTSEYSHEENNDLKPKLKDLNISIEKLKKINQKTQTGIRAKLKIANKKHKLRPTQYHEQRECDDSRLKTDYVDNTYLQSKIDYPCDQNKQFMNTQFNLSPKKVSKPCKQSDQQEWIVPRNTNSFSLTQPENMEYVPPSIKESRELEVQENTFGLTKPNRTSITQKIEYSNSLS